MAGFIVYAINCGFFQTAALSQTDEKQHTTSTASSSHDLIKSALAPEQQIAVLKKEELELAIRNLSRAIELDPTVASAYGFRAEAYRLAGMATEAVHDSTEAISLRGDQRTTAIAYRTRAKALLELGDEEQSDADFNKSVELDPRYVLIRYLASTSSLEGVRRMGLMGIIAVCFVGIFQITMRAPRKRGHN